MPKSSPAKLAYQAEYRKRPEEKAKAVERRRNRRHAEADGSVHKGDGKDIDHKKMLDLGGTSAKSNLRIIDASKNRGWRADHPQAYGRRK
jgi:hypothetical protein